MLQSLFILLVPIRYGISSNDNLTSSELITRFEFHVDFSMVFLQVYCQPLFAFVEKWSARKWPKSDFVTAEYEVPIPFYGVYQLNFFRLVWRTIFVMLTTLIAMLMPFFNDVVGLLGSMGFWPLTVFFPIEMYISQKKIGRWTSQWIGLQILSMTCLMITIAAAVGSVAGVVLDLKTYKPFKTSYWESYGSVVRISRREFVKLCH